MITAGTPAASRSVRRPASLKGCVWIQETALDPDELQHRAPAVSDPRLSVSPAETPIQHVEAVEVVTTEVTEEDGPSSPLPQSPPAGKPVGPAVPESREVKSRSGTARLPQNPVYLLALLAWLLNTDVSVRTCKATNFLLFF